MNDKSSDTAPNFFDLLTETEQTEYYELRTVVGSPDNRYNRNKRLETFLEILDHIKHYCVRCDENDWKRCLVCGVCWMDDSIAINTRQLRQLINKSKSTINGALAKMGYVTIPTKGEDAQQLTDSIPFLRGHFLEMRQWTIRRKIGCSPPEPKTEKAEEYSMGIQSNEDPMTESKIMDEDVDIDWLAGFDNIKEIDSKMDYMYDFSYSPDYSPFNKNDFFDDHDFDEEIFKGQYNGVFNFSLVPINTAPIIKYHYDQEDYFNRIEKGQMEMNQWVYDWFITIDQSIIIFLNLLKFMYQLSLLQPTKVVVLF